MQTATADPLVGRLLEGRYRILDRIARGGMSVVYAAVDERLDRRVAVKVMASSLSADPKFSDRFAREARAAARLTHVNTVAVYDQGVDDSAGHHVFLVMELVSGRTLRDLIRERQSARRGFSPAEAVSIMEPVLSALSAAHRAGLVHRDVKPENILLSDEGLVKVADFGLARAIDADAASTRTGLMMGTVAYCAPEQIVHGRCDQRSDVYSAGIVFFELLTGQPPFRGESAMNVAYQHVHSRVPAPSSKVKGIPTPIDEIVVAATDSDPSGRPVDASAFLAELADTRAQLALPVVPVPPRTRTQPPPNGRSGPRSARVGARTTSTGPVLTTGRTTRAVPGGTGRTDNLRNNSVRHDTEVVEKRPAPPPPVVIHPRRPVSARVRKRRRRLIALVAVLLLGALSVGGGVVGVRLWREWNTHVPKLTGLSVAAADQALHKAGYAINPTITHVFSETVSSGNVVRTNPAAGERVSQGGAVGLVVSLGKDRIPVPDVSGLRPGDAEDTLINHGLARNTVEQRVHSSPTVPQGDVIRTIPSAGTPVRRNFAVVFVVSSGKPFVTVPQPASGQTYDEVVSTLKKLHLVATRTDDYNDTIPSGDVVSIDQSGQSLRWGSTVDVHVSKGSQYVTIPETHPLERLTDLEPQLVQLGLQVEVHNVPNAFGGTLGRVIGVSPASGNQVLIGSVVKVTII